MKIAVVDGQGGGIGRIIVEKLRQELDQKCSIIGLGTNAVAASVMLRAGANEGASGENAVIFSAPRMDLIVGSVAVIAANSFSGELSPKMAEAIASSPAFKILLPLNRCGISIAGVADDPLPIQVDQMVVQVKDFYQQFRNECR
ncbi:MAG TPA: DUF3842 family protein [Syntrophomonadaceae bacterium]|nr:DUF3842 family protein [Syntrophomonadaceae bacterium]